MRKEVLAGAGVVGGVVGPWAIYGATQQWLPEGVREVWKTEVVRGGKWPARHYTFPDHEAVPFANPIDNFGDALHGWIIGAAELMPLLAIAVAIVTSRSRGKS